MLMSRKIASIVLRSLSSRSADGGVAGAAVTSPTSAMLAEQVGELVECGSLVVDREHRQLRRS